MARLTYTGPYQFRSYLFDFGDFDRAVSYEGSPVTLKATYNTSSKTWDEFTGGNFAYAGNGSPVGGTVTGYTSFMHGRTMFTLSEVNIPVTKLLQVAKTARLDDDLRLYKSLLSGNDTIRGGSSSDELEGFNGKDTIIGGKGADNLFGGKGADRFTFESVSDSRRAAPDMIEDFSRAQGDKIDLRKIDAKTGVSGNQAFSFIGGAEFTGKKGQLRFETGFDDAYSPFVAVQGDVNGDGRADFEIHIDKIAAVTKSYFYL